MNKYVVAFYSNFDGTMQMDEVFAVSALEAGKAMMKSNEYDDLSHIKTLKELEHYAFDCDHAIGVYEVTSKTQASSAPVAALLRH